MKNKTIAAFVLAYVLLGSIFSVIPTFADNHFTTIESILNESRDRIDEKFAEFGVNGLEIPQDADSLYTEGLAKYDEAIALLHQGDFENAKEPGLEALSLFEGAYKVIFIAGGELAVGQEGYIGDPFEIAESIIELQNEADEIRNLISINELDISLDDLDATILLANQNFSDGNSIEAEELIKSAEAILNEILDRIEYKAEEDQDKRVKEFVENLLADLQEIISAAKELGVDESVIIQLQDLIDGLTNYDDISDIFEITGASSHHKDVLLDVDGKIYKVELEAELVDGTGDDGGKAKFEQRGDDRKELSVEIEDQEANHDFVIILSSSTFSISTDGDGDGELDLDSRDGDTVPSVMDGDSIQITEVDETTLVLSGTFSREDDEEEEEIEFEGIIIAINPNVSFDLQLEDCTIVTIFTSNTDGLMEEFEVEVEVVLSNSSLVAKELEIEDDDKSESGSESENDSDESESGSDNDESENENELSENDSDESDSDESGN